MAEPDLAWTAPVMRAGYAGRGLVYLVVAGAALWSIWHGREAKGGADALAALERSVWGTALLVLIALGLLAYALWRVVDAIWDLEACGGGMKGLFLRAVMVVTGLIHLGIAGTALTILFTPTPPGGDASIVAWTAWIMAWPAGRPVVGIAGLVIFGAGLGFVWQAWSEKYREHLRANRFTYRWRSVLRAGVAGHAVVLLLIGGFFIYAALSADASEAGGIEKAFEWLSRRAYGQTLVTIVCLGLVGFAIFCFVNAAYRIIPRVAGDDIETLARRLEAELQRPQTTRT